jgi:prepilin-type N-terminal cleavage/methylation domain-containing protein
MTSRRAFTLIELLVVVGLIALLVGGLTLALGDTSSASLASAQNTLATLVGTARAQAGVYSTEVRLCVYATRPPQGDAEKYLRLLQVFRNSTPGTPTATWIAAGNPVYLPRGIYVVPAVTTGLVATGVIWPTNPAPVSTLTNGFVIPVSSAPAGTPFNGATSSWIAYTADGTLSTTLGTQTTAKLVVATATVANGLPQFDNAGAVRGLVLRSSGAVTRANDAGSF